MRALSQRILTFATYSEPRSLSKDPGQTWTKRFPVNPVCPIVEASAEILTARIAKRVPHTWETNRPELRVKFRNSILLRLFGGSARETAGKVGCLYLVVLFQRARLVEDEISWSDVTRVVERYGNQPWRDAIDWMNIGFVVQSYR